MKPKKLPRTSTKHIAESCCLFLAATLIILTPLGCEREQGMEEEERNSEEILRIYNDTSVGVAEKACRAEIQIFNALGEESSRHKKRIEWYKPGQPQIDRLEAADTATDTPQSKRIQRMTPRRCRAEEYVDDKLTVTYLSEAEGKCPWRMYQIHPEAGELIAEPGGSPPLYDRFLSDLRQLSEIPDAIKRETRDGKDILKYASREFGSCPILTFEVVAEEYDLKNIKEVEVRVVHDSEEIYSMSIKVDTDPGEMEDALFEVPDDATIHIGDKMALLLFEVPDDATIHIDEKMAFWRDIRMRASRFYSQPNDEELKAIISELESNKQKFEGDIEYYETWWQFALAAKQFDKAFEYLDKINKIKPEETLYRTITTLVAQDPKNPKIDDDLIAQLREECAEVSKYEMERLGFCGSSLKSVGLDEEALAFYKAAVHAKPYDFVLSGDYYKYYPGSTGQMLNMVRQIEK